MSNQIKVQEWRNRTKNNLIKSLGGKCIKCGYSKCKRALHLHHLKSEDKSFTISHMMSHPSKIDVIIEEAKKCTLLCSNCHAELHDNLWDINDIKIPQIDLSYLIKPPKNTYPCQFCGKHTYNEFYCSKSCSAKGHLGRKTKIVWPPIDFLLSELKIKSCSQLSKELGVSDVAVKKHIKKHIGPGDL